MERNRRGFTLIELLVVIAIIALLLSIILPSIRKAKEAGQRVVCLSNQKQLALSWSLYAQDNDDRFCSPCPGWRGDDLKYSWVAWAGGWPNTWTPQQWEDSIMGGTLWPYAQSKDVYRCPTGEKNEQVTYASFAALGWIEKIIRPEDGEILYKMSQLRNPSGRAVYIDEGSLTPHFYSVYYNEEKWWDQPTIRHNEGVTMSFADGHAEHWKWQDSRTKEMSRIESDKWMSSQWYRTECLDNIDLFKIRRAAWGGLSK